MSLFTQQDLVAAIPEAHQLLGMDDDADGAQDAGVFEAILAEAEEWIGGYLEQAGLVLAELDPIPSRLKHAGVKYAEYALWRRRGHAERSGKVYEEWIKPAAAWLEKIATGKELLAPATDDQVEAAEGGAITEDAKTYNDDGRIMI